MKSLKFGKLQKYFKHKFEVENLKRIRFWTLKIFKYDTVTRFF